MGKEKEGKASANFEKEPVFRPRQIRRINCSQAQQLFYDIGESNLNESDLEALHAHEMSCPFCRSEFESWRPLRAAFQSARARITPPPGFAAGVLARISEIPQEVPAKKGIILWDKIFVSGWKKGIAVAAVILTFFIGNTLYPNNLFNIAKINWGKESSQLAQGKTNSNKNSAVVLGDRAEGQLSEKPEEKSLETKQPKEKISTRTDKIADITETTAKPQTQAGKTGGQSTVSNAAATETRVFLNKSRTITSTLIKIDVSDLGQARNKAMEIARSSQVALSSEITAQNNGQTNIIMRFVVDTSKASGFIGSLGTLGSVTRQDTTSQDITSSFSKKLAEYQALKAQEATVPESEKAQLNSQINLLEQQLESWDTESQKQVVVLWLEE